VISGRKIPKSARRSNRRVDLAETIATARLTLRSLNLRLDFWAGREGTLLRVHIGALANGCHDIVIGHGVAAYVSVELCTDGRFEKFLYGNLVGGAMRMDDGA